MVVSSTEPVLLTTRLVPEDDEADDRHGDDPDRFVSAPTPDD